MSSGICLHLELCWSFLHAFVCQNASHFHCLFLDSFQVCHRVETWCFGQDKVLLRIETSLFNTVMNWTRLLGSKEPSKERRQQFQQFLPALITAICLYPDGSIWPPGQNHSLHNPDEGNEVVPWMNLMPQCRLLCSWQGLSICLACWPCLCQTTCLDPAHFLMEEGRKGFGHHWGCTLWTSENPGEKISWKRKDWYCGNHCYLTWQKQGGSAPASPTWDVKGRKECGIVWWFGAIEMYYDCWWQQLHFPSR